MDDRSAAHLRRPVLNRFTPDGMPYHFSDMQGHFETPIGGGVRFAATAYDGVDEIARDGLESHDFAGAWGNRVFGATLSKTFAHSVPGGDSLALAQRVSTTRYDINADIPAALFSVRNRVTDLRTGGSVKLYRSDWTYEIGYELTSDDTRYVANGPSGQGLGEVIPFDSLSQRSRTGSVYGDALWQPASSLMVEGGLRVEALDNGRGVIALPRLSLKYFLTRDVALIAGAGRYSQWMQSLGREEDLVQPFQFWMTSALAPSVSRDLVAGIESWLNPSRVLHVEAFHKNYERLLVPNADQTFDVQGDEFVPVHGTSYGADVLLRQLDGGSFSGWLAYSYAISTRVTADGEHYFPSQDRRHNLNIVGNRRVGAYNFGARIHLSSGAPYTPVIGAVGRVVYDPITSRWVRDPSDPAAQNIPGVFNSARVPFYDRVDVSVRRDGTSTAHRSYHI